MNNKYYAAATILAITAAAIIGAGSVAAQGTDNKTSMIKQLAQKLGIEESRVQTAMDAIHAERHAEMQKQIEARFSQAVKDGKITESQKQLILKKHEEMRAEHEQERMNMSTMTPMTPEERRAKREERRAELESWAKENGIDMSVFMLGMGPKGGMRGFGHMR